MVLITFPGKAGEGAKRENFEQRGGNGGEDGGNTGERGENTGEDEGKKGGNDEIRAMFEREEEVERRIGLWPAEVGASLRVRGNAKAKSGEWELAGADFGLAASRDIERKFVYVELAAQTFLMAEEFFKCIRACQLAIELNPSYAAAHWTLARALLNYGEIDQAVIAFETAEVILRGDIETANGDIETANGDIETANGDIDTAKGDMETAKGDMKAANGDMETAKGDGNELQQLVFERESARELKRKMHERDLDRDSSCGFVCVNDRLFGRPLFYETGLKPADHGNDETLLVNRAKRVTCCDLQDEVLHSVGAKRQGGDTRQEDGLTIEELD